MRIRRRFWVGLCCVIGTAVAIAVVGFFTLRQMGLAWPQPPVDLSATKVEVSQSDLFTSDVLHKGVTHIENDVSFMRGCSIERISYDEPGVSGGGEDANENGTQATFEMSYVCDSFNSRTLSMSPRGSYSYRLEYAPDKSVDGTGWVTLSHGNG